MRYKLKKNLLRKCGSKAARRIDIKNGDEEPVQNGYHSFVTEKEFQKLLSELRNRIVKRTMYQVKIDTEQFISECIAELNEKLRFKALKREFLVAEGKADYDASRRLKFADPARVNMSVEDEYI